MGSVVSRSWNGPPVARRLGLILVATVLALLGMSLVLPAAVAIASPAPTPTRSASPASLGQLLPRLARPFLSASTPTANTVTASYSCDFSGYGAGITPATMSATYAYPSAWPVNQPMPIELTISSVALPSQVSSALTGVTSMRISATVTTQNATQKSVLVSGSTTATLANPPTSIPQTDTEGEATFAAKGTGVINLPVPTIFVVPLAGSTTQAGIECTTQTAAKPQSITVDAASGPFYNCVSTIGAGGAGNTATISGPFELTVTGSGTRQVGKTVSVTLGSDDIAALIVVLAAEVDQETGTPLTEATFTADMAVTGAQSGALHPSATVTDLTDTSFSTSESLKLSKAGTVDVDIPATWSVDLLLNTTSVIDVACKLVTTPAPVGLALHVTQPSATQPSATPTQSASSAAPAGAEEGNGTPVGAPDTGGGLAPAPDVPLALGGLVVLLVGGGLVTRGVSRRRR